MNRPIAIAVVAAAFGFTGCASTETQPTSPSKAGTPTKDEEYVTGSRLPR